MRKTTDRRKKRMSSKSQMIDAIITNSTNKIKKQGGSPSEISNKRKTQSKIAKDATKEIKKLFIPASSKKGKETYQRIVLGKKGK
tara:strand:+ start:1160 stop:1414 length:255 start_codon:yes stop_codon:yes gene_type:complete